MNRVVSVSKAAWCLPFLETSFTSIIFLLWAISQPEKSRFGGFFEILTEFRKPVSWLGRFLQGFSGWKQDKCFKLV
jgi:hypothetical protein